MGTNVPLGAQGESSLGAIPSSPPEQISAPSALFCLWRSQPGDFVPSGKAVLRMSPIGCQAPEAAKKDAHSQPCSRKLPLQEPKVFLSLIFLVHCLPLWMSPFPRSQLPGLKPGFAVASAGGDGKELGLGRDLPCAAGFPEGLRAVPSPWGEQQGWEVWDQTAPQDCPVLCKHEVSAL